MVIQIDYLYTTPILKNQEKNVIFLTKSNKKILIYYFNRL
jgi:hypothetical protein